MSSHLIQETALSFPLFSRQPKELNCAGLTLDLKMKIGLCQGLHGRHLRSMADKIGEAQEVKGKQETLGMTIGRPRLSSSDSNHDLDIVVRIGEPRFLKRLQSTLQRGNICSRASTGSRASFAIYLLL